MKPNFTALVIAALMCGASVASVAIRPSQTAGDRKLNIVLETAVPKQFGDWTEVPGQVLLPDPATQELLGKLYSQILSRNYVYKDGYRIMLSLAYGDDQRGGLRAHRPEVCYPSQGFNVGSLEDGKLPTPYGDIAVRRLTTQQAQRREPVTYWLTVGEKIIQNDFDRRIEQIRLGLTGQIPDGLLFRISSVDDDPAKAFAMQQRFAADMMSAVQAGTRRQLSGLSTPVSGG